MSARTIGIVLMIAVGLAALIGSGSSKPGGSGGGGGHHKTSAAHGSSSASKDVRIASCTTTNGQATAKVVIVNHSSKTSNYNVAIAFESSDGKVHERSSITSADNVPPGGVMVRNTAVSKSSSSGKVTCKVDSVTRWAS
jgi:hypothetical protein